MEQDKLKKTLNLIADAVESGYSSVFTFATRENLDRTERGELSEILRHLAQREK